MMGRLFACYNGFQGNGYTAALVEASDEETARTAARVVFKAEIDAGRANFFWEGSDEERVAAYTSIERVDEIVLPAVLEIG